MSSESPRSGVRAPSSWEHYGLWRRVRQALFAVPDRFVSPTRIEGLLVQDIFTLNAPLAATIEEQVVETLNRMRAVWDPDGAYRPTLSSGNRRLFRMWSCGEPATGRRSCSGSN